MKISIKNNQTILCGLILLFNIAFFALMEYLLPIRFEVNDDIIMCMIANGVYSGIPDCHLVFINAIYGSILALLYFICQNIEWYTLSFCIIHILSITAIIFCIVTDKQKQWYTKTLWIIIIYVLWTRIILAFQFTTTAGLACAAGCVLLLQPTNRCQILGGGLLLIASLIRFQAAGLVTLLFIPLFLYNYRLNYKRYIPMFVIALSMIFCKVADGWFYKAPEWQYYKEYNALRGQMNDNPNSNNYIILNAIPPQISKEDYQLLLHFCADPQIMNLTVLKQIHTIFATIPLKDKITNVVSLRKYGKVISILLTLFFLTTIFAKDTRERIYICLFAILTLCTMVGIALNGELKDRVFLCTIMSAVLVLYYWQYTDKHIIHTLCVTILVVLLATKYVKQTYNIRAHDSSWRRTEWQQQMQLLSAIPHNVYLVPLCMNIEYISPFSIKDFPYHPYAMGWMTSNPLNRHIASSHTELANSDIFLFIDKGEICHTILSLIQQQLCQHYGFATRVSVIVESEQYQIIQLIDEQNLNCLSPIK